MGVENRRMLIMCVHCLCVLLQVVLILIVQKVAESEPSSSKLETNEAVIEVILFVCVLLCIHMYLTTGKFFGV